MKRSFPHGNPHTHFKKAVLGSSVVTYLFATSQKPHHLDFSRILLSGDEVAFFEIGDYASFEGFRSLSGWLNSHRE